MRLGNYDIYPNGDIYSHLSGKFLKQYVGLNGYKVVNICTPADNKKIPRCVHSLVATMYVHKPRKTDVVNHKDSNRLNNDYHNLEWVSNSDNLKHGWSHGNMKRGEDTKMAKLTTADVVKVCELLSQGVTTGKILESYPQISRASLLNIRARRTWKHIGSQYEWTHHKDKRNELCGRH
jgi:hypothetical protein